MESTKMSKIINVLTAVGDYDTFKYAIDKNDGNISYERLVDLFLESSLHWGVEDHLKILEYLLKGVVTPGTPPEESSTYANVAVLKLFRKYGWNVGSRGNPRLFDESG